jgi:hypothetical protein
VARDDRENNHQVQGRASGVGLQRVLGGGMTRAWRAGAPNVGQCSVCAYRFTLGAVFFFVGSGYDASCAYCFTLGSVFSRWERVIYILRVYVYAWRGAFSLGAGDRRLTRICLRVARCFFVGSG